MIWNEYPYSNVHELNLDWLLSRMKKLMQDVDEFKKLVDGKLDEQDGQIAEMKEILDNFIEEIERQLYPIASEIINQLIESGAFQVGVRYDEETEALTIVFTEEGE